MLTEKFYDIYLLFKPFYLKTERHSSSQSKPSDLDIEFDWSKNQYVHFDFAKIFGHIVSSAYCLGCVLLLALSISQIETEKEKLSMALNTDII